MPKLKKSISYAILITFLLNVIWITPKKVDAQEILTNINDSINEEKEEIFDGTIDFGTNYSGKGFKVNNLKAERVGTNVEFTIDYDSPKDYDYSFFNPPNGDKIKEIKANAIKAGGNIFKIALSNKKFNQLLNSKEMTMQFGFDSSDSNFIFFQTEQLKSLQDLSIPDEEETFDGNINFGTNYSEKGFKVNNLKAERVGTNVEFTIDYDSPKDYDYSFFNPPNGDKIMEIKHNAIKAGGNIFKIALSNKKFNQLLTSKEMTMKFGVDSSDSNFIFFQTEQLKSLQDLSIPEEEETFDGNIDFGTNYSGKGFKVNNLKAERVGTNVEFTIDYDSPEDYDYSFFNPPNGDKIKEIKPNAIKAGKNIFKIALSNKKFNQLLTSKEMTMKFGFDSSDSNFIFFKTEQLKPLQDLSIPDEEETFDGNIDFGTNYSGKGFKVNNLKAERVGTNVEFTIDYDSPKDYDYSFFNPPNGDKIKEIKPNAIKAGKNIFKIALSNKKFNQLLTSKEMTMKFGFDSSDSNFIFFKTEQLKPLQDLSIPDEEETFDGNIDFGTNYSGKGFKVNNLKAERVDTNVEFTIDYDSPKDYDYSFFNPPNGDKIEKLEYGAIKKGHNILKISVNNNTFNEMLNLKEMTMKFGFQDDDQNFIFFFTNQLKVLQDNSIQDNSKVEKEVVNYKNIKDDNYNILKELTNVNVKKDWKVNFKGQIDPSSINPASVFILDEDNNIIETETTVSSSNQNQIILKPIDSYETGKVYRLFITNRVKGKDGKRLKKSIIVKFTT